MSMFLAVTLSATLATLTMLTTSWADEPKVVEAQIYPDQAIMVMPMPKGSPSTLDVPGTINPTSIKLESDRESKITGFSMEEIPRSKWTPPALAATVEERDLLYRELNEIQGDIQSLEQTLKALDELKPEITPSEVESYSSSILKTRGDLVKRLIERKDAMSRISWKLNDLQELIDDRMPDTDNMMTRILAEYSGSGSISVRCSSPHAGWMPSYRLDLDMDRSSLTAQLNGTVWQRTGLPFSGRIGLHMNRPPRFNDPIRLDPLTVRLITPSDNAPSYRGETRMAAPMVTESMMSKAMDVAVEETLLNRSFSFEGTLRGDGVPSTVILERWSADIKSIMVTVPSVSEKLWLIAEGTLPDVRTMEAQGEMYVDGRFSGKGDVPKLVRGESFSIPFGEVPGVQVEREDKIPQSGSTWIGKGTLRKGYSIKITNGLDKELSMIVKDRVPIATDDKVSISISTITPAPSKKDDETGIVTWSLDLKPNETSEIHVIYDLRYPSDKELVFSR